VTTATTAFEGFLKNIRLPEELANQCRDEHLRLRALLLADPDLRDIIVSTFLQGAAIAGTRARSPTARTRTPTSTSSSSRPSTQPGTRPTSS
jgi:hypothetical protein